MNRLWIANFDSEASALNRLELSASLRQSTIMLDSQVSAAEKLTQLQASLSELQVKEYIPPLTPDSVNEDGSPDPASPVSPEYDFADAYYDPAKAMSILIEIGQVYVEMQGNSRVPIITAEEAQGIMARWKLPTSERRRKKLVPLARV